jgi:hypothetical protein
MTSRIIRTPKRRGLRPGDDQMVTTTYEKQEDGSVREHITLETPKDVSESQRLRLLQTWENQKDWPT